ncbi:hypothetical protein [Haloarchaeobius sp. TZWWS8]|uniref:hypothetical protein n=1 Tax=Haloarchaeobius sp. TZWWS8 TaxID=3446121 RepID=UPI003EBCFDD6
MEVANASPGVEEVHPSEGEKSNLIEIESIRGVFYQAELHKKNLTVVIQSWNPTNDRADTGFNVHIDRSVVRKSSLQLGPGETIQTKVPLHDSIAGDVDNHTLTVSTFGDYGQVHFDYDISSKNPNGIELPEIENVEIDTIEIDGEETAIARVTVTNGANVQYLTRVRVHTLETQSDPYDSRVPLDGSRKTVVVPLNERPGKQVAGEVRLYTGRIHNDSDIADQVEFSGTVDGETDFWHRPFEPIAVRNWSTEPDEVYQYHNESAEQQNEAILRERLKPVGVAAAGLLLLILLVGALVNRKRGY